MTKAETAAAEAAHQIILQGIKGQIRGGRPGERRAGRGVTPATSDGFREAKEPQRIIETDIRRRRPDEARGRRLSSLLKGSAQSELKAQRKAQRIDGIENQLLLSHRKLGSLRSHLELLVEEKLTERMSNAFERFGYGYPDPEAKLEYLAAGNDLANLAVLQKMLGTKITRLEEELTNLADERDRLNAELEN